MILVVFIKIILYQQSKALLYLITDACGRALLNKNGLFLFEDDQL